MKLCVVGPTFPFKGGISHFTTLLVEQLRLDHDVDFVSFKRQYPKWLFPGNADPDPSDEALHCQCEYLLDPLNPLTWLKTYRHIKRGVPDLLLLQWWTPYWTPTMAAIATAISRRTSIPILFLCHHITPPDGGPFDFVLARTVLSRGDEFIVLSETDYADLRKALPDASIYMAKHPTYEMFSLSRPEKREARATLGYQENEPLLLFFGFVRRYKGLRHLLKTMAQVSPQLGVKLLVVGEFWEPEAEYQTLVSELGLDDVVRIVNRYVPNEEMGLYFSAADGVILPYLEATQSGIAQIAFGFDLPVITTSVGGLPETVRNGEFGLVVPPQDEGALAEAIETYFERDMAPKFREKIQAERDIFSWARLASLIEEIFEARV